MTEQLVRGYMIFSTGKYLEKAYDDDTRAKIFEKISPRVRGVMQSVNNVSWYPKEDLSEMFAAIALHHQETDGKVRQALSGVGWNIAEMATNTFLKLIMKLLTPSLFKSKLPSLWSRDHKFGSLTASVFDTNERRLVTSLNDVGGYDYIGPVGEGYLRYAIEAVFKFKNAQATYAWSVDKPGPDVVAFDMSWD